MSGGDFVVYRLMFDIVGKNGRDARAAVWNGLLRVAHLFWLFAGVLALAGAFSWGAYLV